MKRSRLSIWDIRRKQKNDYGWAVATFLWVLSWAFLACFVAAVLATALDHH